MKNILFQDLRQKINGKNVFDQSVNNSTKKIWNLTKTQQDKGIITQQGVSYIIHTQAKTTNR